MRIHDADNVEVRADGQKYALSDIGKGESVIKYGFPIGHASTDIVCGEQVGPANLQTNLTGLGDWSFEPCEKSQNGMKNGAFLGYLRPDGRVGIRNEIWVIPTVGCAAGTARLLAERSGAPVRALCHPYGCSQLGDDLSVTQRILVGLCRHPNAGGVLLLGLGCENNGLDRMKEALTEYPPQRVRFLNLQDCEDELADGLAILRELKAVTASDRRTEVPLSKLCIGVKCGGSDGYSGITANPLVGLVSERFAAYGARIVMTEIPEIFGAEQLLLGRCDSEESFDAASRMIRDFRRYFMDHGVSIAENPSPGNVAGGITTLEEKSLGCVQKAGKVPLCGALQMGDPVPNGGGLYLVDGPGNDQVAITNLTAAGAHMILFTTGRGTPLCAPVPTLKISTNTALATKKKHWIDFDAGAFLHGERESLADGLLAKCLAVAEGEETKGELGGYADIAIFKNGVTL